MVAPADPKPRVSLAMARANVRHTAVLASIWGAALCVHMGWFWPLVVMPALVLFMHILELGRLSQAEAQEKAQQSALDRPRKWP